MEDIKREDFHEQLYKNAAYYDNLYNDAQIIIRLPAELKRDFEKVCGKNASKMIRRIFVQYITEQTYKEHKES